VDRQSFDADSDRDPIFHFDVDPDPDPDWHQSYADLHADHPTTSFSQVGNRTNFFLLLITIMPVYDVFLFSSV
jgi:hypothetical protein